MKTQFPRELGVRILTQVLSDGIPLDDALAGLGGEATASGARAWLQEVCAGTLRWKGRLDAALDATALKKKPSGWLRKILLLACYQLIVQERTSPAAVVNETIEAIRRKEGEAPARFANAVLRKVSLHAQAWRDLPPPSESAAPESSAWASLPTWLWLKLVDQRGPAWASDFARACLERPQLWLRTQPAQEATLRDWAAPGPIPASWKVIEGGSVTQRAGFVEGTWIVQDISSQRLVYEVSQRIKKEIQLKTPEESHDAESLNRPLRALDLCAAPGGKSVALSWEGFEVSATDQKAERIALLSQTFQRVGQSQKIGKLTLIPRLEVAGLVPQDLVWVDAPCSGTGIIRRHPDVRWLRREKEIPALNALQLELLKEGWSKVCPGGYLAYSVCSVLKEEGEGLVQSARLSGATQRESWFFSPQDEIQGDGFWAILLKKTGTTGAI